MSQLDDESQGSWKESISDDLPYSLHWWSWKESTFAPISNFLFWMVLKEVNLCHLNNGPERSQFAPISKIPPNCLERSQLISPKRSWKESVCVPTLFVTLILAVLSVLYGDVVLLYSWLLCLYFGCTGDVLMGSIMNSLLLHSMVISPLSMGVSLAAGFSWALWWTLLFCIPWGSLLYPWGSPWAAGSHWGCLSASCLALYCWGWVSPVVQVWLEVQMQLDSKMLNLWWFRQGSWKESKMVLKEPKCLFINCVACIFNLFGVMVLRWIKISSNFTVYVLYSSKYGCFAQKHDLTDCLQFDMSCPDPIVDYTILISKFVF